MKKILKSLLLTALIISSFVSLNAQELPAHWSSKVNYLEEGKVEVEFTVKIDPEWHVYSQRPEEFPCPYPTSFSFDLDSTILIKEGSVSEPEGHIEFDEGFEKDLKYFEKEAKFVQVFNTKPFEGDQKITGVIEWMACKEGTCTPPNFTDYELVIKAENIKREAKSYWVIFVLGFGAGLLAILTPCVFPMIPMTVSFFTKQSKTRAQGKRNALLYGFFIIVIYVGLGLGITIAFGGDALYSMASNPWFNLVFFVLFMIFAFSFLGAFEIRLPNSWINKSVEMEDKGGVIGIFFMALTLALVSFSCTGMFVGSILIEASQLSLAGPFWGMFGFSTALALPFTLFAFFPSMLNSLPQSGGWLNSVKVVLGLVEVGLAFKFLSNADLAWQWWFLTRELFIAIWIVICFLVGMYLIGKLKFSHDSDLQFISVTRIMIAIVFFVFGVYLIPGLFGAPLKMVTGFTPPSFYSEGWNAGGGGTSSTSLSNSSGGGHNVQEAHCPKTPNYPDGIPCFHDYDEAMAYAKEVNKPLFVDFTGWTCANCRWMEENMWVNPSIESKLAEDFVVVSLYVDSREEIEEKTLASGKVVNSLGGLYLEMEQEKYGMATQPLYVIEDHEGNKLSDPFGYTRDEKEYESHLEKGLEEFKKKNQ